MTPSVAALGDTNPIVTPLSPDSSLFLAGLGVGSGLESSRGLMELPRPLSVHHS